MKTTKAEVRFKNTVQRLINKQIYPSPRAINKALGRGLKRDNINGMECMWRRQICFALGFKLLGINQLDEFGRKHEFGPWWTKRRFAISDQERTQDEC